MRNHTIRTNVPVEVDGVRGRYDVTKIADPMSGSDTYSVDLSLGAGWTSRRITSARFDRPAKGITIVAYAHEVAKREMRNFITRADNDRSVYVVIEDFPGYAEERLGKHVRAGYWMDHARRVPTYVVKAKDSIEADEIVALVETLGDVSENEGESNVPVVINVTDHAYEALGKSVSHADDAVTALVAQRVEDVVDAGIGA